MPCFYVRRRLCLYSAWLFSTTVLCAQQIDTVSYHPLSEVEVVEKVRPSVMREGVPVQQLKRSEIERLGVEELSEAVKRFSGVSVKDYGGIGGLKTVSVRSLGAQQTAVSYDGITISDAQSGQVDISRFTLDNVEAVSLSIGQTDDIFQTARMYGSASALSIQTSKPVFMHRPFNVRARVKGGSFGLFNPTMRYEQKLGNNFSASGYTEWLSARGDYPFTLTNGNLVTEKTRKNSDIQSLHLEGNVYGTFRNGGEITTKIYYYDSERGLPGSVILYNDYARERLWDNNFFTQIHYKDILNDMFSVQAQAKYNYTYTRYRNISDVFAEGKQEDRNTQQEYYASAGLLFTPVNRISASLTSDLAYATLENNYMNSPSPVRWTSQTVLAAQYEDSQLMVTASLLGTYVTDEVKSGKQPADKKRLSPAASFSLRPFYDQTFRIRASYKDIFRIPTFADLYYLRMGNVGLRPEKTRQYNVGLTWTGRIGEVIRYLSVSTDGYYNQVEDKIVALPTMYVWKMMNMGEVDIKGVDVNVSAEIPVYKKIVFLLSSAYSYQHAIDITDPEAKNYRDQIPYTPKHSGSVSATIENPWVNVTYSLTAAGDRYALPQNIPDNRIDGYVEQGISLNKEFIYKQCKWRIQGEVLNLGDKTYDIIQYYPMPGRSWRLSIGFYY